MLKSLTAAVLSGAIALGAGAAPAQARDRGETVRTIVGIAALGLLLNEMSKDKARADDRRPPRPDDHHPGRGPDGYGPGGYGPGRHSILPAACAFDVRVRGERQTVLGKRCIEREMRDTPRLPGACAFEVRVDGDRRTVYGANCLERSGFRIGRR